MIKEQRGFTLIEVLIAMSIVAVIGLASAQVISSVLRSDEISAEADKRITLYQKTYQTLQRDIMQIAQRNVRVNGGVPQSNLLFAGDNVIESEFDGIVFTRNGWRNPVQMFPRSTLQNVGYRVTEGTLERLHFLYPDQDADVEPQITALLHDVMGLKIEYFYDKKWQKNWSKPGLPEGIAFVITSKSLGEIRWQFMVVSLPVRGTDG